jgi:Protein of unknown function (DUF2490)
MKSITLIIVAIAFTNITIAQRLNTENFNTWFVYNGDHKISNKWGVHIEAQLRRNSFVAKSQQLLLRGGFNYHFNPQVFATVGYCFVQTAPYGAFPEKLAFPENRYWEQVQVKNTIGKTELINRYRLEQRYSQTPSYDSAIAGYEIGDAVYTNRVRILNRISVPLAGKTIADKSWYLTAYDEIFANFGKQVGNNLLDQNRFFAGLGYKIPNVGRIEFGYLEQTIVKGDGLKIENNHTLQVALNSTIDFFKKKK